MLTGSLTLYKKHEYSKRFRDFLLSCHYRCREFFFSFTAQIWNAVDLGFFLYWEESEPNRASNFTYCFFFNCWFWNIVVNAMGLITGYLSSEYGFQKGTIFSALLGAPQSFSKKKKI